MMFSKQKVSPDLKLLKFSQAPQVENPSSFTALLKTTLLSHKM